MLKPLLTLGALALMTSAAPAVASITVYAHDLTGFNSATGAPPIAIDFDTLSGNIAGTEISGVTFSSPPGNSLDVVRATSTTSVLGAPAHKLPATSGDFVLSPGGTTMPGGPNLAEEDSLELVFTSPVSAFGLDVLFESLDCCSYFDYTVYGAGDVVLSSGFLPTSGSGAFSGSVFLGFASDDVSTDITRIVFTESDGDSTNPDANVGYDTFRFFAPATGVPEPGTWAMMLLGFGMAGAALRFGRSPEQPKVA